MLSVIILYFWEYCLFYQALHTKYYKDNNSNTVTIWLIKTLPKTCTCSLHFPYLPSEILLVKPIFPLPSIGCYFVLYKSISGRPNSLKQTQEGLLLFWLQKSLFHLFHPFIQTCWIRLPLLLSLISYHVCHAFSGSSENRSTCCWLHSYRPLHRCRNVVFSVNYLNSFPLTLSHMETYGNIPYGGIFACIEK